MKVIRNNKCVKIVPEKFKPVLDGFAFESESKRLSVNERYNLLLRLIKHNFKPSEYIKDHQMIYACNAVSKAKELKIIKINKRGHSEYRVLADGLQIRIDNYLVSDCPKEFLEVKHEF